MKTRTILPILVLAVLAWLPGSALANVVSGSSCAVSNYTKTAFGETFKATSGIQQRYTFAGREASANAGAPMFYRNRNYSSGLGRFNRRDPVLGGDSLYNAYGFPTEDPAMGVDPYGLWGKDVHINGTTELAKLAGYRCNVGIKVGAANIMVDFPAQIGKWANRPDEKYDPPAIGLELALGRLADDLNKFMNASSTLGTMPTGLLVTYLEAQANIAQLLHFPLTLNDKGRWEVIPGSQAARALADQGLKECNLERMSVGLHVLQDSWAHQGIPSMMEGRLAHARDQWGVSSPSDSRWRRALAGMSHAADDAQFFAGDAIASLMASYDYLKKFNEQCPCIRAGEYEGTRRSHYFTGKVASEKEVENSLKKMFPGLKPGALGQNSPYWTGTPHVTSQSVGYGVGAWFGSITGFWGDYFVPGTTHIAQGLYGPPIAETVAGLVSELPKYTGVTGGPPAPPPTPAPQPMPALGPPFVQPPSFGNGQPGSGSVSPQSSGRPSHGGGGWGAGELHLAPPPAM